MHPHFLNNDNIPEALRPDVITALNRNRDKLQWDYNDLRFLFEVYNRYVAPAREPENINCGGCRTKVIGKLRQYAARWTTS